MDLPRIYHKYSSTRRVHIKRSLLFADCAASKKKANTTIFRWITRSGTCRHDNLSIVLHCGTVWCLCHSWMPDAILPRRIPFKAGLSASMSTSAFLILSKIHSQLVCYLASNTVFCGHSYSCAECYLLKISTR